MKVYDTESNIEVKQCDFCENMVINPAKSKRVVTCKNCAHVAKFGESLFVTQQRKLRESQLKAREKAKLKPPQYKPVKKIPFFSEKGKERHKELLKVKNEVRQQAFDNNEYYCRGCGKATGLDCSHNIGLGQTVTKATDKDNLTLLCHFCHSNWESNNFLLMSNLHCFQDLMKYLFRSDTERFEKKVTVILRHLEKQPTD